MAEQSLANGDRVRFTKSGLGVVGLGGHKFVPAITVDAGDEGTYVGPAPFADDDVSWSFVAVERDMEVFYCPCIEGEHFERVQS